MQNFEMKNFKLFIKLFYFYFSKNTLNIDDNERKNNFKKNNNLIPNFNNTISTTR